MTYVVAGYALTAVFWLAYVAWTRTRTDRQDPR